MRWRTLQPRYSSKSQGRPVWKVFCWFDGIERITPREILGFLFPSCGTAEQIQDAMKQSRGDLSKRRRLNPEFKWPVVGSAQDFPALGKKTNSEVCVAQGWVQRRLVNTPGVGDISGVHQRDTNTEATVTSQNRVRVAAGGAAEQAFS